MVMNIQNANSIIGSKVIANQSGGLQMRGCCLVVDVPYVVHTTKTEVDHNLWYVE